MDELVKKWKSFPEGQHTPLCAHLLGLAMKTVTQLALGERFGDDTEVLAFRKNHDAVRNFSTNLCAVSLGDTKLYFIGMLIKNAPC